MADAGYHSGQALEECASRGHRVAMPESQRRALRRPYHKDRFTYDESSDNYRCPQGQALRFIRIKRNHGVPMRRYRASGAVCRACPAFGTCTKDARYGRALEIGPHDAALRVHREWMSTEEASRSYERRQGLIEPVSGSSKTSRQAAGSCCAASPMSRPNGRCWPRPSTCAPSGASGGPGRTCGVTDVPLGRQLRPESGDARSARLPSSPHTGCHDTPTRPSSGSDQPMQCSPSPPTTLCETGSERVSPLWQPVCRQAGGSGGEAPSFSSGGWAGTKDVCFIRTTLVEKTSRRLNGYGYSQRFDSHERAC